MLKTTMFQSMAIGSEGIPSMAIFPPWAMLSSMSRNALGFPDISRPTSKPSFIPSCFCASARWPVLTLRASVAPIFFASSRR